MDTLESLLAGIVADPLEETRWLVLADWLEEFDDPRRAELLRLHRRMLAGVERGETDPVFSHHSPHSTLHDLHARIVALLAEGVRPCVPQETVTLPGGVGMTFSFIPPGSFLMGSDHADGYEDEKPVHRVTLTKGFFLGIHPVTQAQWKAITGESPSYFRGDNRPVEKVSWDDSQEFCRKLTAHLVECEGWRVECGGQNRIGPSTLHPSHSTHVGLPSEAEWEYACRAGTTTEYHFGDVIAPDLVNYNGVSTWNGSPEGKYREETTEVGSFPANPWGLFDMHGNVWEWCQDSYGDYSAGEQIDPSQLIVKSDDYRVVRGGGWNLGPGCCRSAYRTRNEPKGREYYFGCRVRFRLD